MAISTKRKSRPLQEIRAVIGHRESIAAVAKRWGVSEKCIYDTIRRCGVRYVRLFGKRYIDPDDLRTTLVSHGSGAVWKKRTPAARATGRSTPEASPPPAAARAGKD